jgi:predicted acylesterase/phospholipase RssA
MPTLRARFVLTLISFSAQTLGCVFLMPDRIHWNVEPTAPVPCEAASQREPQREIFGVALSGGGSRAAVYAAAGLEALWEHGLIDRISHISSVSGGSIASSYFVANRPACDDESSDSAKEACWREFFAEFKRAMRYDFAWASEFRQVPFPNRWLSHTRRASSFQEVLDREFLAEKTFGDLATSGANTPGNGRDLPVLLVNAASYDEARRFVFSNLCIGAQTGASRSASFSRPGCNRAVPRDFPVSLAVTSSAAFPGLFGPVALEVPASCEVAHMEWWHLGDGGMIDNTGVDTLEEVVMEAAVADPSRLSTALLISFDASKLSRNSRLRRMSNYALLSRDPARIVEVTKARGNAYHALAWQQQKRELEARGVRADELVMPYMAADLESWPASCKSEATRAESDAQPRVESIRDRIGEIPTLLSIDDCGADLLEQAAHQIVHERLNGDAGARLRALGISFHEARD